MARKLTWLTFILVLFGLAMISSAGVFESLRNFGSSYYYVLRQLRYGFLFGTIGFLVAARMPIKRWQGLALPLLLASVVFLVMVFIPGIGLTLRGSSRWLDFRYFSFQPAEILKLTLVLYLAAWLSKNTGGKRRESAIPFFTLIGFISLLIAAQPDLGTLAVILSVAIMMYFLAGARIKHVVLILLIAIAAGAVMTAFIPNRVERILAFINRDFDPRGIGYHVRQSVISIGAGGLTGVGFGKGIQKTGFLPEPVGDSIFAVIVEELGFVGAAAVLITFSLLSLYLIKAAKNAPTPFAKLTAAGIFSLIVVQLIINISAVSGLLPFTGITLPFISYGSTSLIVFMTAMGIAVRIAKETKRV